MAGKVTGPGGGLPPTPAVSEPGGKVETPAAGAPRFADKLAGASSVQAPGAARAGGITTDLAAETIGLNHDELRERMSGNLCRCGAYNGIAEAIAETFAKEKA